MAWLTGWSFRKLITVQAANVDADLDDFPLYVKLAADVAIGDGALATGYDIRFTAADGTTLLKYESESWTGGNGTDATADFWVKSDLSTSGTDIYIYYGKADATDGQDAANVWDSSFQAVWHLPNGTSLTALDSTSNNLDCTVSGASATSAKVDGGASFDSDQIACSLNISASAYTVQCWFYNTASSDHHRLIEHTWNAGSFTAAWDASTGHIAGKYMVTTGDPAGNLDGGAISVSTWYHVAMSITGTTQAIYTNGSLIDSQAWGSLQTRNQAMYIGGTTPYYWAGSIDEVRLSTIARPAAWIKFEYYNIANADAEATWGAEEEEPSARRNAMLGAIV